VSATLPPLQPTASPGVNASRLARWAGLWWRQASMYLPVALMGMLSLVSFWVVSQTPRPEEPRPPREVSQEPDYFMRDFAVRTFAPDGTLRSEIMGEELRRYPADQAVVVDQARLRAINEQGRVTTAQARELFTNEQQSFYTLTGDVIVIRESIVLPNGQRLPRLEFRGESLTYLVAEDTMQSDQPVLLLRDNDRMQADSLIYRDDRQEAVLRGRVRATLNPRP